VVEIGRHATTHTMRITVQRTALGITLGYWPSVDQHNAGEE
jgi:hypothetical protein